MTIEERKKNAEEKRDEAFDKGSLQSIVYWDGYLAALADIKASEIAIKVLDDVTSLLKELKEGYAFFDDAGQEIAIKHAMLAVADLKKEYLEEEQ